MTRTLLGGLLLAGIAASATPARADVAQLSATYDSFLQNTVFTVRNTSAVSEAIRLLTSLGPNAVVNLPNLAAGMSTTYTFNMISGGFETDPQGSGIPDTTTYTLLVGLMNATPTLASNTFSPLRNATGGQVDFLGNDCVGTPGPGINNGTCGADVALAGVVGIVPTPSVTAVPEPRTAALFAAAAALLGLTTLRRRGA